MDLNDFAIDISGSSSILYYKAQSEAKDQLIHKLKSLCLFDWGLSHSSHIDLSRHFQRTFLQGNLYSSHPKPWKLKVLIQEETSVQVYHGGDC